MMHDLIVRVSDNDHPGQPHPSGINPRRPVYFMISTTSGRMLARADFTAVLSLDGALRYDELFERSVGRAVLDAIAAMVQLENDEARR